MSQATKHTNRQICPRCEVTLIKHVYCTHQGCLFHIHVCDHCDRAQAVNAFMADHAKDCTPATRPVVRLSSRAA